MSGLLPLQQQLRAMGPEYSNAASWTSYQLCPRASIFRRNFSDVVDVESMKHLMRSNDYATDKVCRGEHIRWPTSRLRAPALHSYAQLL